MRKLRLLLALVLALILSRILPRLTLALHYNTGAHPLQWSPPNSHQPLRHQRRRQPHLCLRHQTDRLGRWAHHLALTHLYLLPRGVTV